MTASSIPVADLRDWQAGGKSRDHFIRTVGESLTDIGFFALASHGIPDRKSVV